MRERKGYSGRTSDIKCISFMIFKYHKPVSYKKGHSAFIKSFSYVLRIERREIKFQHLIKHKSSIYKIKTRDQKN